MPAQSKYPTAAEQLRELCVLGLRDGITFGRVWELAVRPGKPAVTWHTPAAERPARCIVWPRDTVDRRLSIIAIQDTRSAWQSAYDGKGATRNEAALTILSPDLPAEERDELGLDLYGPQHRELPPEQLALAVSLAAPR